MSPTPPMPDPPPVLIEDCPPDSEQVILSNGDAPKLDAPELDTTRFLTDLGNAARFARAHGGKLKYTKNLGWLIWTGTHWEPDETGAPVRLARKTALSIFSESRNAITEEQAKNTDKWALESQSQARLGAMQSLAQSEHGIVRFTRQFDRYPWLLNCANGTLDLQTGVMSEHSQADLLTHCSPTAYDEGALCPRWDEFLLEVFGGDTTLIEYVQKAVGYSLTADTREQCLFFLHGSGENGKSTFTNAFFSNVFSTYHKKTRIDTILQRQSTGYINNDVARLRGARAVVVSEIPEGRRINESLVKDLTGGDPILARFLNQEYFEFMPAFKLWMYGNHKPIIRGTDRGIWRRMRLIPFEVTFPDEKQDKGLPSTLKAEAPGILAWAVRGCTKWQRDGLDTPSAVNDATKAYRAGMDTIGQFLGECTTAGRVGVVPQVKFSELYNAYDQWCSVSGERAISKRKFGERIIERGLEKRPGAGNVLYVHGVGLLVRDKERVK